MKKTAIIYCRRSQDRDDRQQNSLETQLNNCFDTLEKYDLWIVWEPIVESVSAKTEFKRAWFNRIIENCKKRGIDYIIIDEPKRLSRNNIDNSRIIDLMDKDFIEGILTTSREYLTCHPRDKFLLQLDLSLSKMDNEERGIDVKKKMITALHRWQWLSKAIFWYRNVWKKGNRDVEVIEKEASLVLEAFVMRSQLKTLSSIADFLTNWSGTVWNAERVSKMLKNTKYYWLQTFGWEESLLDSPGYKPIVWKELYDKVNRVIKTRDYKRWGENNIPRYFLNILMDVEGNKLYPYETKKRIYYHQWSKSNYKVNISQDKLLKEFEKHIGNYNFPEVFICLLKATFKEHYKDKVTNQASALRETTKEINKLEIRKENLVEKYLDNEVVKELYEEQKCKIEKNILLLEEKRKALKQWNENVLMITEKLCKLVENLSDSYKTWDSIKKGQIIKAMQCKLILNKKKQLTIKDNKLFEMIKSLNFQDWYSHGESNSDFSLEKATS